MIDSIDTNSFFYNAFIYTYFSYIYYIYIYIIYTNVVVTSVLKIYNSDPLSVIYRWKGLGPEMVLKQCSGFGGHSLEGSKGDYSGFLKKFYSTNTVQKLNLRSLR